MGTEGHFDQESLQTLREVMEEEFVELFELFIKDSSQRLQRIELAVEQLDSEALCAEVHSLKGSSGNICAIHLSALAKDLEQYLRNTSEPLWASVKDQLKLIETEFLQIKGMVESGQI